jgi:hypothetical protein
VCGFGNATRELVVTQEGAVTEGRPYDEAMTPGRT